MIIYNVTVSIEKGVSEEWVAWMRDVHIPKVMATGYFLENRFAKVLLVGDDDGVTYTTQYVCKNMADLQVYQGSHAQQLQAEMKEKYEGKYADFRTVLETIETP